MSTEELIKKGLSAKRESKYVDFKVSFVPSSKGEWCEIIKDIVAMANSGGGIIVIGLNNDSTPSGSDVGAVLEVDPAVVTDKIHRYTGYQFSEFEIHRCEKESHQLAAFVVFGLHVPMVFQKPGEYSSQDGRPKSAFAKGTLYFRHGAKSEPGNMQDLQKVIERNLESIRGEWLAGVRKVVQAPRGTQIAVLGPAVAQSDSPETVPIRLSRNPDAPEYKFVGTDDTHPHCQKELIIEVNALLPEGVTINSYDAQAVRRVHQIQDYSEYMQYLKHAAPQYSDLYVDWIIDQFNKDSEFFNTARERYSKHDY